jgi:hypothetical protein
VNTRVARENLTASQGSEAMDARSALREPARWADPPLRSQSEKEGLREKTMQAGGNTEEKSRGRSRRTLWAYGYEIIPSQGEDPMKEIATLLSEEHENAKRTERVWAGRMVREQRITHIMVVSDSPDQTGRINRRIETRLKQLKAGYSLSLPMAVADGDPAQPPAPEPPPGQNP